jgi:hypothetical protein
MAGVVLASGGVGSGSTGGDAEHDAMVSAHERTMTERSVASLLTVFAYSVGHARRTYQPRLTRHA